VLIQSGMLLRICRVKKRSGNVWVFLSQMRLPLHLHLRERPELSSVLKVAHLMADL